MTDPIAVPEVVRVSDGVHVRVAIDNLTWIDTGEYLIVVDALEQPELESEVFEAIDATGAGKPVRYLLNTHTHYDHVALNKVFAARGAEIVNMRTAAIPAEGRWFEGTARRVQMLPLGGCHTEEDCVVWVEPDKVLAVGDIFGWGLIPLTRRLTAETAQLLLSTYRRLIDFGADVVVPGHGPLCTTAELVRWCGYFTWLRDEATAAAKAGLSDDEIADKLAPPDDMHTWWRFLQWKHADSRDKIIAAARRGGI